MPCPPWVLAKKCANASCWARGLVRHRGAHFPDWPCCDASSEGDAGGLPAAEGAADALRRVAVVALHLVAHLLEHAVVGERPRRDGATRVHRNGAARHVAGVGHDARHGVVRAGDDLSDDVDQVAEALVVRRRAGALEVRDEQAVVGLVAQAVGRVVNEQRARQVAAERAEVLGVPGLAGPPLVVAVDAVLDRAVRVEHLDHRLGVVALARGPDDDLDVHVMQLAQQLLGEGAHVHRAIAGEDERLVQVKREAQPVRSVRVCGGEERGARVLHHRRRPLQAARRAAVRRGRRAGRRGGGGGEVGRGERRTLRRARPHGDRGVVARAARRRVRTGSRPAPERGRRVAGPLEVGARRGEVRGVGGGGHVHTLHRQVVVARRPARRNVAAATVGARVDRAPRRRARVGHGRHGAARGRAVVVVAVRVVAPADWPRRLAVAARAVVGGVRARRRRRVGRVRRVAARAVAGRRCPVRRDGGAVARGGRVLHAAAGEGGGPVRRGVAPVLRPGRGQVVIDDTSGSHG
mmetsp:Transcript_39417/g.121906  ORF Transcript_39417/g.121906 Transcript_39417/m.121906 type:complete len:521 (-) Transcript_39417:86-1648(-)